MGRVCGAFLQTPRTGKQAFIVGALFPLTDPGVEGARDSIRQDPNFAPALDLNVPRVTNSVVFDSDKHFQTQVMLVDGDAGEIPEGYYFLPGTFQTDDDWLMLNELVKRDHALAMVNAMRNHLRQSTKEQVGELVVTWEMLTAATDDTPDGSGREDHVLWSDLGLLADGRKLVVADIWMPEAPTLRFVTFFADGKPIAGTMVPGPLDR